MEKRGLVVKIYGTLCDVEQEMLSLKGAEHGSQSDWSNIFNPVSMGGGHLMPTFPPGNFIKITPKNKKQML